MAAGGVVTSDRGLVMAVSRRVGCGSGAGGW